MPCTLRCLYSDPIAVKTSLLALLLLAAAKQPDVAAPGDLWKRLGPPRTGDWRDIYREEGQTFAEYRRSDPVRGTQKRRTIYLQPLLTRPPKDPRLLEDLRLFLGASFGRQARLLPPRPLPARAYLRERRQVSVARLAPSLLASLPEDALFLLAITDRDIFVGKLGYSFGWGSFTLRIGVMSTYRVGWGKDPKARRRRILSLAAHEAGHLLSMRHCTFYGCLMNGARTLAEADRRPLLLCPVCLAKLCWNLGLDPQERYQTLAKAYRRLGFARIADQVRRAARLTRLPTKD